MVKQKKPVATEPFDFRRFMSQCFNMYQLSPIAGRPETWLSFDADLYCEIYPDSTVTIGTYFGENHKDNSQQTIPLPNDLDNTISLFWQIWGKHVEYGETELDYTEMMKTVYHAPF